MASLFVKAAVPVLVLAVGYQLSMIYNQSIKHVVYNAMGVGRHVQKIGEFDYDCRQLRHPLLEACEDMWLDEETRLVYAACASTAGRLNWNPSVSKLNASGRGLTDHVAVLEIDNANLDGLFGVRKLATSGYKGATGDESLDLHGFEVELLKDHRLRFWLINHRPPVDANGRLLDASKLGANSTIEIFDLAKGSSTLEHVATIAHEAVITPNNLALSGTGGVLISNDKSTKVGFTRELESIVGGGNIAYCDLKNCSIAASHGFNYPNGIKRGLDGLFYVPSAIHGEIRVMSFDRADFKLTEVAKIEEVTMPIDNLFIDGVGDIYAAAFPKARKLLKSLEDPTINPPSAVWQIRRLEDEFKVTKILEDSDGEVLPGSTVAVHDVKTGRLILGGVVSPFITVCERKE